jgi:hypothetical protein
MNQNQRLVIAFAIKWINFTALNAPAPPEYQRS